MMLILGYLIAITKQHPTPQKLQDLRLSSVCANSVQAEHNPPLIARATTGGRFATSMFIFAR